MTQQQSDQVRESFEKWWFKWWFDTHWAVDSNPAEHVVAEAAYAAGIRAGRKGIEKRPKIVCLCGSTRFYEHFKRANYEFTMLGVIVLSVGFYPHAQKQMHSEDVGCTAEQKIALDELHKRKIDLADEVYVLNVDGYIGSSTRSEIDYAETIGKPVSYLRPNRALPLEPEEKRDERRKWIGLGYTADFYDGAAQAWGEQAKRKAVCAADKQREIERLIKRAEFFESHLGKVVDAAHAIAPECDTGRDVIGLLSELRDQLSSSDATIQRLREKVSKLIEGLPNYSASSSMYQRVEAVKALLPTVKV